MIKKFGDKKPSIEDDVYIAETAVIIGDVILKENSNIWFGAVIRGDVESIVIGDKY